MKNSSYCARLVLPFLFGALALSGCVTAPKETVHLADITMQQMTYIEASHRELVRSYFDELEYRIDVFIDDKWAPSFLDRAIQNPEVQEQLTRINAGLEIDAVQLKQTLESSGSFSQDEIAIVSDSITGAQSQLRADLGQTMIYFAEAATQRINRTRQTHKQRLLSQEREAMNALDLAYSNVRSGHLATRAYLQSVVEVVEVQQQIVEKLDLSGAREKIIDGLIDLGNKAENATSELSAAVEDLSELRGGSASASPDARNHSGGPLTEEQFRAIMRDLDTGD